jgi:hypothetical protein
LVVLILVAVMFGSWVERAHRQRNAVSAIRAIGGSVHYEHSDFADLPPSSERDLRSRVAAYVGDDFVYSVVWVDCRQMTDKEMVHMAALRHCDFACFDCSRITDDGIANLRHLESLEHLRLRRTLITDKGVGELKRLRKLRILYLSGTVVSDDCIPVLRKFTKLEVLFITGTSVTPEGVERLKLALPSCTIK